MRKYLIHTILGMLLLTIVGMQLVMSPIVGQPVGVSLEIKPKVLNLKRNGGIITASIEFRDSSYNISDINFTSIELHVETAIGWAEPIRCIVAKDKLIAEFNATEVAGLILTTLGHMQPTPPPKAEYPKSIVVKGEVNGEDFEGTDRIKIILP